MNLIDKKKLHLTILDYIVKYGKKNGYNVSDEYKILKLLLTLPNNLINNGIVSNDLDVLRFIFKSNFDIIAYNIINSSLMRDFCFVASEINCDRTDYPYYDKLLSIMERAINIVKNELIFDIDTINEYLYGDNNE